jgi:hypothetical protein
MTISKIRNALKISCIIAIIGKSQKKPSGIKTLLPSNASEKLSKNSQKWPKSFKISSKIYQKVVK